METLALIELLDRDGLPRQSVRVTSWPVRIGRAIDSDVVVDDPHVAPRHAQLVWRDGQLQVEAGLSINGVHLGRATLAAGASAPLPANGQVGLGATMLRVRLASEALAPELPLLETRRGSRRRAISLVVLLAVMAMWTAFSQWLASAPGESGSEMTDLYLAAPVGLGIWCGLWALGSKLFQRHFAFWPHLHAALLWPLLAMAAEAIGGQAAFALSMPVIAKVGHVIAFGALAMLLWRHLAIVLPSRRHSFAWCIAGLVAAGGGLDLAERAHHQQPLIGSLYLGTISVPGLRIAAPVSVDAFVHSTQPLEKTLSHWSKAGGDDADVPDPDGDDEE